MAQSHGTSLVPADGMSPALLDKVAELRQKLLDGISEHIDFSEMLKALQAMISKANEPGAKVGDNRTALKATQTLIDLLDSLTPKVRVNAGNVNINQTGVDRTVPVPAEDIPAVEYQEIVRRIEESKKADKDDE